MAIELKQQLKLTQQLVMTPQLQMAIKLLQLSRLELLDAISQELEENPALEEVQDVVVEDQAKDLSKADAATEKEVTIEEKIQDNIDWSNYIDEYNAPGKTHFETEERDVPRFEAFIAHKQSLSEHLLWQLLMTSPSNEEEEIGSLIIGNLNPDGYLETDIQEMTELSNFPRENVEKTLALLQTFDQQFPPGKC